MLIIALKGCVNSSTAFCYSVGEHVDYSGYGVLPMAIAMSTHILVSWRDTDEICFANTDAAFPSVSNCS